MEKKPDPVKPQLIDDEELVVLLEMFCQGSPDGISEEEAGRLLTWAENSRLNGILLKMVLDKRLLIGKVTEKDGPVFKSNPEWRPHA